MSTQVRSQQSLTGWGRTSPSVSEVVAVGTQREVQNAIAEALAQASATQPSAQSSSTSASATNPSPAQAPTLPSDGVRGRGVLARGMGRSYGDAAQNGGGVILDLAQMRSIRDFDAETGVVTAEAGVSIEQLIEYLVPRGYFVPVTPGTRQVSVGGAIAADVHGKNHHRDGSFGDFVEELTLITSDGTVRHLTPHGPESDLFWATVGGMGLTGVITEARFRCTPIETSQCLIETRRCANLAEVMAEMDDDDSVFSVAWVDSLARGASLGRSVLTRGRFARVDELPAADQRNPLAYSTARPITAPGIVPPGALNRFSVAAFNEAWYRKAPSKPTMSLESIPAFFHPLDMVQEWNRIYGPRGFLQYQVLIPDAEAHMVRTCFETLSEARCPSFLTVLKKMGPRNAGHLSFPGPGWTLTLDIPAGHPNLGQLLNDLDQQVVSVGGRSYFAKDSRMSRETVAAMYPRLDEWREIRHQVDPQGIFISDLARRLGLCETL